MTAKSRMRVRRISFPPEAIFQSAIQDGDTPELLTILNHQDRHKLDIDQHNHTGITALHQCVLNNNLDAIKLLLNYGADLDMADVNGMMPLHTASACGFLQVASLLVIFGASVFAQTDDGDLPVDLAKDMNMVRFLQDEMISRIQRETYVRSLLMYEARSWLVWCVTTCAHYLGKFVTFLVYQCKIYMKRKRRKVNHEYSKLEDSHGKKE